MNKKTTVYLVFVTLLALLLNLVFSLYILELAGFIPPSTLSSIYVIVLILSVASIGAFSSFIFSTMIARYKLGVTLINQPSTYLEKWLFTSVERQSRQLEITTPKIGVFYASDLNAFTTGWGQKHVLFAVSSGLLENLNQDELEAVIGHELAHIEHGDMIPLSISQGVVVSLTEFPARIFGFLIDAFILRGKSQGGFAYNTVYWCCMLFAGIFPHFIVMWVSRQREFSADNKSALLNGEEKMISALQRLSGNLGDSVFAKQLTALGVAGGVLKGLAGGIGTVKTIFSSHPPISKRIMKLSNK